MLAGQLNDNSSRHMPIHRALLATFWPLSVGVRKSVRQDGDHRRNPSFIYNCNILDTGFAML